jgi:two-component system sensor histidine kinase ChvG
VELALQVGTAESGSAAGEAVVWGVEHQLERLVRNLLDNALAFCESRISVSLFTRDTALLLTVCDDGPGVAEGDRDKVFVRFFSSRPSREGAGSGTGLGLAIVDAIAQAHGGEVALEERGPLPGACFRVKLASRSE